MTALDPRTVREMFASAGLCDDIAEIVELHGGMNSQVFEVRCADAKSAFVLKRYAAELGWKMAKEVFVYGLLERDPSLPTPRILVTDESGRFILDAYAIMTKLPGVLAASVLETLPERDVERVYAQLGEVLRAFHATTFDAFGYLWTAVVDPHPTNAAYMEFQFAKKIREFADLGGNPTIARDVERAVGAFAHLLGRCSQAVLCHDDLHEGNVLLLQREGAWTVVGVLDVENAVAGDPMLDLAKTDYYAIRGDPVKRRGLLDGYGSLPEWGEHAIGLYRLYHAIELWDWYALNGNDERLPGIAEDIVEFVRLP